MTSDGRIFATERFNQIIRERFEISKRIHTSYNELGEITPKERQLLLQFIKEDIEHDNKVIQQSINKSNNVKRH